VIWAPSLAADTPTKKYLPERAGDHARLVIALRLVTCKFDPTSVKSTTEWRIKAMQAVEVQEHARKLFEAHGAKALTEAAQKAKDYEVKGERDKAQDWRQIEAALKQMRGPLAS
jgi:hypothetical protein